MEKTDQPQNTHRVTTNTTNNQDKTQTNHTTLLRLKAGYVQHTSPIHLYASTQMK